MEYFYNFPRWVGQTQTEISSERTESKAGEKYPIIGVVLCVIPYSGFPTVPHVDHRRLIRRGVSLALSLDVH